MLIEPGGEPVLVDFGLARSDGAGRDLTLSGQALGTPAYMAPEQVEGRGAIDRRTDVYGLGVLLYECTTLRTPFVAESREQLYRQILGDAPPDPRAFDRRVGPELRAVLDKALARDPRRRFQTAAEFADELERIRRHEPIRTRSPGPVLRTWRWCQRNPAATAILATGAVAPIAVTPFPSTIIVNAIAVDPIRGMLYFGGFGATVNGPSEVWQVPLAATAPPQLLAQVNAVLLNLHLDAKGQLVLGLGIGPMQMAPHLMSLDPSTRALTARATGMSFLDSAAVDGVPGEDLAYGQVSGAYGIWSYDAAGAGRLVLRSAALPTSGVLSSAQVGAISGMSVRDAVAPYGRTSGTTTWNVHPGPAPTVGNLGFTVAVNSPAPSSAAFLLLGGAPARLQVLGIELLVDPTRLIGTLSAAPSARTVFPLAIPPQAWLRGLSCFAQVFFVEPTGLAATRGLVVTIQ